jgi:hypothetical protein
MRRGADTPEELDTLLEDAVVLRDAAALAGLFEPGGVLAVGGAPPARGPEALAGSAPRLWGRRSAYVAGPARVLQARDLALVAARPAVHVARRAADGGWRLAISLVHDTEEPT